MKILAILLLSGMSFAAEKDSWRKGMQDVSQKFSDVVPYLFSTDQSDLKPLAEKVTKLKLAAKNLNVEDHILEKRDYDPVLLFLGKKFVEDISSADISLREGFVDYARYTLRNSLAYCISCHTRTSPDKSIALAQVFTKSLKDLPWLGRVEYLAASRQFDSAFTEILAELKKKPTSQDVLDLETGARLALLVSIRVAQDPDKALEVCRAIKASPGVSHPLKQAAGDWERDVLAWKKEKTRTFKSEEAMLKTAQALLQKAEKSTNKGTDEVWYLRASALLHDFVKKYPDDRLRPEALYSLGLSYAPFYRLDPLALHEKYFRACILASPHSAIAEKCFKKYEENLLFQFSGSSGTHVPPQLKFMLQELKTLAAKDEVIL